MQYWSFCDLWRWFALVAKTTFSSTEWFQTRSQNFQTPSDRGYFFYFFSKSSIFLIFLPRTAWPTKMSVMKDLKLHLMISNHFIWNWKLQFMTPHCIDQIRNTAFPIGEIFCCLGARPLQIQPRHHPPNSSEEGGWINWDVWQVFFFNWHLFSVGAFDNRTWDPRL